MDYSEVAIAQQRRASRAAGEGKGGVEYQVADVKKLAGLGDEAFDVGACVWEGGGVARAASASRRRAGPVFDKGTIDTLSNQSEADVAACARQVARVLKPAGAAVSITFAERAEDRRAFARVEGDGAAQALQWRAWEELEGGEKGRARYRVGVAGRVCA